MTLDNAWKFKKDWLEWKRRIKSPDTQVLRMLGEHTEDLPITVIKIGQKLDLSSAKPPMKAAVRAELFAEAAYASQFYVPRFLVFVARIGNYSRKIFSAFGSNESGNLHLNKQVKAASLCKDSFRLCLYNASHYLFKVIIKDTMLPKNLSSVTTSNRPYTIYYNSMMLATKKVAETMATITNQPVAGNFIRIANTLLANHSFGVNTNED